jgi:hypothetical protein
LLLSTFQQSKLKILNYFAWTDLPDVGRVKVVFRVRREGFLCSAGTAARVFVVGSAAGASLGTCAAAGQGLVEEALALPERPEIWSQIFFSEILKIRLKIKMSQF